MTDETDWLREDGRLCGLLSHYAEAGTVDRAAWLDRVMVLADAAPDDLSQLHGRLLAAAWVEQNTGQAVPGDGTVRQCYRVTPSGRQALRGLSEPDSD